MQFDFFNATPRWSGMKKNQSTYSFLMNESGVRIRAIPFIFSRRGERPEGGSDEKRQRNRPGGNFGIYPQPPVCFASVQRALPVLAGPGTYHY